MSDPLQTPSLSPAPEPVAPTLPNPQDMVDAALSSDTAAKTETAGEPKTESLPPLTPLSSPTPEPVVSAPNPIVPPVATPAAVTMGDDTPLAFAGMTRPTTAPVETSSVNTGQPITPPPTTESAPLPPVVPQAPEPKKKGKFGKMIVGMTALVLTLVAGAYGYYTLTGTTPQIANLETQYACNGRPGCRWTGGGCKCGDADPTSLPGQLPPKPPKDDDDPPPPQCANGAIETGACQTDTDPNHMGKVCKGIRTRTCSNDKWGKFGSCVINVSTCVVPGSGGEDEGDACTIGGKTGFRHGGVCVPSESCSPTDQNGQGCPIKCNATTHAGWTPVQEPGGGSYCDAQGRQCNRYRKELLGPDGRTHCFVGYGEQCGQPGSCGSNQTPPPSAPPGTPVLACTGLTSVPSTTPAPVVGTKLTFTCAGSVTPTTAGTLSYKFRYSINNGAYSDLTPLTATPNKVELTVNACGSYKVQCQACATIAGVLKCDPVWTGVTQ